MPHYRDRNDRRPVTVIAGRPEDGLGPYKEGAMTATTEVPRLPTGARMRGEPELWGALESAECLGVSQPNLRTVKGLPEPYDKVRATTLWRADEIRALAAERNARLGREAA